MSDLGKRISDFEENFEKVMVDIHSVATDISLGTFNNKKAKEGIEKALQEKQKLEEIIKDILRNPTPEFIAKFQVFITSYRPQLDAGLEAVKVAAASPPKPAKEFTDKETPQELKMIIEIQKTIDELKARNTKEGTPAPEDDPDDEKDGWFTPPPESEPVPEKENEEEDVGRVPTGYEYDETLGIYVLKGLYDQHISDNTESEYEEDEEEEIVYEEEEEVVYEEEEDAASKKQLGFINELAAML